MLQAMKKSKRSYFVGRVVVLAKRMFEKYWKVFWEKKTKKITNKSLINGNKDLLVSISGIRGTLPKGLHPENIVPFVRAFGLVTGKKIIIARDSRPSGFFIHQLTVGTLLAMGKDIIDVGIVPTPTAKHAVSFFKADGGIVISASHNPLDWNGYKFIGKDALFFGRSKQEAWRKALRQIAELKNTNINKKIRELGCYTCADAVQDHICAVINFLSPSDRKLIQNQGYSVVVDGVGGAGGPALTQLLKGLGCSVIPLYCEPTPTMKKFPRPPEPTPLGLKKFSALIKKNRAAIGFALDPDADRLVVGSFTRGAISEEYTLPLSLLGLLTIKRKDLLHKKRKASNCIVINLSTASLCDKICHGHGLKVIRSSVGEANVVDLLQKKKAIFGGEGNGGVILLDIPSLGRDPLVGVVLILLAMAKKGMKSLDTLLEELPMLYMEKSKHRCGSASFPKIVKEFLLHFPDAEPNYQDGLYLSFPDKSWIHLRSSNTEPIIRLIIEGTSQEQLKKMGKLSRRILSSL